MHDLKRATPLPDPSEAFSHSLAHIRLRAVDARLRAPALLRATTSRAS